MSGLAPSNLTLKKLDWPPYRGSTYQIPVLVEGPVSDEEVGHNRGSTYQIPVLIEGPTSLGDVDEPPNAHKVLIRICVGMPIWNRVRGDEVKVMGSLMIS